MKNPKSQIPNPKQRTISPAPLNYNRQRDPVKRDNVQNCKLKFWLSGIWLLMIIWNLAPGAWNFASCYAGDNINSRFVSANSLYEQGSYDEAIRQYNSILEAGWESGNLYYNLGNCYFKKQEIGRVILNYEKARQLIPLDRDLESNYEYARSLIKGGEVASSKSWPARVLNSLFEKFSVDGLTILISALYILVIISILISLFFKQFKKHGLILAVFTGLFFIVSLGALRGKITLLGRQAIVITEQADVKFEPMDKATTYFVLYEGMKVRVISSKDDWHKISRRDNKSGWVRNNVLGVF